MKINRITYCLSLLVFSLSSQNIISAQDISRLSPVSRNQLAEPDEIRANEIQPPELVIDILGIKQAMTVGEVGAGHGRLTVHLAERVGEKGKVYANDIDPEAINYLKTRCQNQGLKNVETILGLPDDARFPQNSLDAVVMAYVYHHIDDPIPLLKSILPSLKPWGLVALAEPKPGYVETYAKPSTGISVAKEVLAAGFTLEAVIEDQFKYDNIFILRPSALSEELALPVNKKSNTATPDSRSLPSGCSVITISKGDRVLFGGNDDYINPDSYYWVEKGDPSGYGVIWIGTPDNPQQGINEKGVAYDASGLPRFAVNPHTERNSVDGQYYHSYVMQIMHECSTVKEVIDWINSHQRFPYMHDQMHFADKTGDAVIVSAGMDGEIVFTRKTQGDGFLVSTNFNVANPSNGYGYPCWRFDKANDLLEQLIDKESPLSYEDVTLVMEAIHQESSSWTIETLVADLTDGVVYLYYFYQYDDPVIINIKEELSSPREAGPLSKLFPANVQQEAAKRYREVTKVIRINNIVGKSWIILIIVSIALLLILPSRKKGLIFWIPAVIVLGPVALVAKHIAVRRGEITQVRKALIETTGDLIPVSLAYLAAQVILVLKTVSGGVSEQQQVLWIFGLPLISAWLLFHNPFLASAGNKNFFKFLFQRLPQVLVVTLLGLAGIFPVAMPLLNKSLAMSQVVPLSLWIVMTWWLISVAGSLAGGLFIFFYEHWAVKRGYQAWNVFAGNDGEVTTPGLRKIWWWIIVSVLVLVAGMVAGIILQKL